MICMKYRMKRVEMLHTAEVGMVLVLVFALMLTPDCL
jgi:hypothetical protein